MLVSNAGFGSAISLLEADISKMEEMIGLNVTAALAAATTATCSACGIHPAPAPLLGAGIPSAIAIGGTLLGAKFWGRTKK
jgi:hypothetical protein